MDYEAMAASLEASGEYRVLRKIRPRKEYSASDGSLLKRGLFIDVETTGLSFVDDEIIELAMVPFSYGNTGKESLTDFVMINSPDIDISNDSIEKLFYEIKKIKNFALFAPTYLDESIHKNYFKKFDTKDDFKEVLEVEWIDNSFIINKNEVKDIGFFDENFFIF